tara:strand:+ start:2003 stop:2512 length:510 start_codon:yes stop_codon:yes gene_type:complete
MTYLFVFVLIALGACIIRQDYKSLSINASLIYAFTAVSLATAVLAPLPDLNITAHFVGGFIAATTAVFTRLYFGKLRQIEALGEADVWLIASAGLLLGPFMFGPWLFVTATLSVILMCTNLPISGKRNAPEVDHDVSVMPLTPALIISMIILVVILHTELLPANQLPLL